MNILLRLSTIIAFFLLTGCSAVMYQNLHLDGATQKYPTQYDVDPGGLTAYDTSVNPESFPVVLIKTNANIRNQNFEFMIRSALAQLGNSKTYNFGEFKQYAKDRAYQINTDSVTGENVSDFSKRVAPILLVDAQFNVIGAGVEQTTISITDGRSGNVLFSVNHNRRVWSNFDTEAIYPVLNRMRSWYIESAHKAA